MDAKKSRDEAEAEDESNKARNQLAANEEAENEELTFNFKVGEKNDFEEQNQARLNELNNQKQQVEDLSNKEKEAITARDKAEADEKAAIAAADKAEEEFNQAKQLTDEVADYLDKTIVKGETLKERFTLDNLAKAFKGVNDLLFDNEGELDGKGKLENYRDQIAALAKKKGIDIGDISKDINGKETLKALETVNKAMEAKVQEAQAAKQEAQIAAENARNQLTEISAEKQAAQAKYTKAQKDYETFKADYWANAEKTKAEEEAANAKSNAEVAFESARDEINNADIAEETKAEAIETINNVEAATKSVNDAANALAANPNDPAAIETYVNAVKAYNENVENALKGNPLAKTDHNKTFTEMVAKANDFDVTMPDGTKVSYAEFAAEKAVESPALAKGLYEAKAKTLAEEGHPVLAAIENAKAKMVTTWLGSKFTFADNQVRSQFNQMAKTDMRATYATYNNVLNDETGKYSEADKAEASAAINQANALMTASAALQASTGFFSGIGDSMKDGVYGVTDPNALTVSQKTMNTISNFAKVVLGLGVTPGANEAYQNMYYIAGAKVKQSGLFGRDFDSDGFALCQEYGNNAAAGMIAGVGELATGIALFFNPATAGMGLNLAMDSVRTFLDGLYGVQREAKKSVEYSSEIIGYLNEAKDIVSDAGEKEETVSTTGVTIDRVIDSAISQIENFELKSDEANNLDNWLEGSGSNTTGNEKFNQSLTYDEWLKLIEADPTMQDYAKKLIAEKA